MLDQPSQTAQQVPILTDESNIELNADDVAHFQGVLQLLAQVNVYLKTPVKSRNFSGPEAQPGEVFKRGNPFEDSHDDYWAKQLAAYGREKPSIQRLIYYYGRNVNHIPYDSEKNKGMYTPYGTMSYFKVGYRGIENLMQEGNYKDVRDMVVGAIKHYRNDHSDQPDNEEIKRIFESSLAEMRGKDFIRLLNEWERMKEVENLYASLY